MYSTILLVLLRYKTINKGGDVVMGLPTTFNPMYLDGVSDRSSPAIFISW
jgi:hypothetical protein